MLQKEAISREEYDITSADYRSARSQTQLIRAQLAKTTVNAPFSGKIGLRSVSVGEYVTPSTPVTNLVSINPVKVSFSIPEKYSGEVKVNTTINFTVAGSTQVYRAKVYAIEPQVEATTRTLQLRNIFNRFLQKRREQNATVEIRSADLDYQRINQSVNAELSSAYQTYLTNLGLVKLEESNQKIAAQNLDITLTRYRLGTITQVEIRDAQLNYLNSSVRLNTARNQAKLAEVSLKEISGDMNLE